MLHCISIEKFIHVTGEAFGLTGTLPRVTGGHKATQTSPCNLGLPTQEKPGAAHLAKIRGGGSGGKNDPGSHSS